MYSILYSLLPDASCRVSPRPMHPPLSKRLLFDLLCSNENPPPQRLIITALQRGKQSVYLSDCLIHLHCVAAETMRSSAIFLHKLQNRIEQDALRYKENRCFDKAGLNQQMEGLTVHHGEPKRVQQEADQHRVDHAGNDNALHGKRLLVKYQAVNHAVDNRVQRKARKEGAGRTDQIAQHIRKRTDGTRDKGPE